MVAAFSAPEVERNWVTISVSFSATALMSVLSFAKAPRCSPRHALGQVGIGEGIEYGTGLTKAAIDAAHQRIDRIGKAIEFSIRKLLVPRMSSVARTLKAPNLIKYYNDLDRRYFHFLPQG